MTQSLRWRGNFGVLTVRGVKIPPPSKTMTQTFIGELVWDISGNDYVFLVF
jgi:hypothetical protein